MKKIWQTKIKLESRIKNPAKGAGRQESRRKEIIKVLFRNRGLKTKKQIDDFLNPSNPYDLDISSVGIKKREINKAISRIKKAIANKKNIVVYGDYDADGICATAIIWETLHFLGAKVMPFIPDREKHGYGLNIKGIKEILNNPSLIITVDNGIVAHKAIDYCNKKGIEVIVTDHHQRKLKIKNEKLKIDKKDFEYDQPRAKAIVWSDKISGAGVAWFLAKEVYKYFKKSLMGFKASNVLELACIGTICDLMPLLEINRSIVKYGIQELRKTKRQGMLALISEVGVEQKNLETYHIGYIVGPRLNAMGRLANALDSLRLLCTKDKKRAKDLAYELDLTNRERQQLTQETSEHAKQLIKKDSLYSLQGQSLQKSLQNLQKKIIFLADESYQQGVIGLVAGKLVEEFYRPAIVVSKDKEYSKGSARSIKGFNIIQVLRKLGGFEDVGGHPMAAGFTIKTNNLEKLKKNLQNLAQKELKDKDLQPKINIDCQIDLYDISWELYEAIEKFSPFGLGNARPTFSSRDVKVVNIRQVGRGRKHLKLCLTDYKDSPCRPQGLSLGNFDAIGFNLGHFTSKISLGDKINICFSIDKNFWNNKESLQLKVKDIKILD